MEVKTEYNSVYKVIGKKDNSYRISYMKNGVRYKKTVGKESEGFTAKKAYEVLCRIKNGGVKKKDAEVLNMNKISFAKLAKKYFQKMKILAEQEQHLEHDKRHYKSFKNIAKEESLYNNFWGAWKLRIMPLAGVDEKHVVKFLTQQKERYSHKTIMNALALAKSILKHTEYDINNPFDFKYIDNKKQFKKRINARKRFLSVDECKLLVEAAKEELEKQNYILVMTNLLTGARPDSVLHLKMQNVNLKDDEITFFDFKRKMYYTVPLDGKLGVLLGEWMKNGDEDREYVFYSAKSKGVKAMSQFPREIGRLLDKLFNTDLRKDEERVVLYTLRHTFANILLQEKKLPLAEVSYLLNHASIQTTIENYINIKNENIHNSSLSDLF